MILIRVLYDSGVKSITQGTNYTEPRHGKVYAIFKHDNYLQYCCHFSLLHIFIFLVVLDRNDNNIKGRAVDEVPLPLLSDKSEGTVALVKPGTENIKRTPAGEYLTSALNDFDPEQYDSLAAISDGANKLLMLV